MAKKSIKKKIKKLPTLKKLQKIADKLWQDTIRKLYKECAVCGAPMKLGHHFFAKHLSNKLRYNIKNGVPLCVKCHFKHHRSEDPFIIITIYKAIGENRFNYLLNISRTKVKINRQYYNNTIQELQTKLEELS